MKVILIVLLIFVLLLMVGAVVAYQFFGVAGLLGVFVLLILLGMGAKHLGGLMLKKAFSAPFKAKGAVLKDATVEVHGVTVADPPYRETEPSLAPEEDGEGDASTEEADWGRYEDDEADDSSTEPDEGTDDYDEDEAVPPSRWYWVDVTITPGSPTGGGFTMWEPGELSLASESAVASDDIDDDDDERVGEIHGVQLFENDEWTDDEGMKYGGPRRIRLHIGLHENVRAFRFRYYFEVFGKVEIPAGM